MAAKSPCKVAFCTGKGVQKGLSAISCAKTAEPIEMSFGIWTHVGARKHVLHGAAHWLNLANTSKLSMCGGDAALCQITLTTCYYSTASQYHICRCGLLLPTEYRGLSVCLCVTLVYPAKMTEPIEMPFGLRTWMGPGNHVLDGGPDPPWELGRDNFEGESGVPL